MRLSATILSAALLAASTSLALAQQPAQAPSAPAKTMAAAPAAGQMAAMPRHKVEEIQAALQQNGEKLATDGIWGPKTTAAMRDYQKQHGLKTTGRFDQATAKQLKLPQWNA